MIGLVVLDVANPFLTDVARGVEDEANKSGLSVILCNSDDKREKETRYLERFRFPRSASPGRNSAARPRSFSSARSWTTIRTSTAR